MMPTAHPHVQALLEALAPQIRDCNQFSSETIGDALHALRNHWKSDPAILSILEALYEKAVACPERFTPSLICRSLRSIVGLTNIHPIHKKILKELSRRTLECAEDFKEKELTQIFTIFQGLESFAARRHAHSGRLSENISGPGHRHRGGTRTPRQIRPTLAGCNDQAQAGAVGPQLWPRGL